MIGDESSMVLSPSSPTSTGHVLRFSHSSANLRNSSGGSVKETNSPPTTSSVVWVEQKVWRSVLSLSSSSQGVVLVILIVSLKNPSRKASAAPRPCRKARANYAREPPRPRPLGSRAVPQCSLREGLFLPAQVSQVVRRGWTVRPLSPARSPRPTADRVLLRPVILQRTRGSRRSLCRSYVRFRAGSAPLPRPSSLPLPIPGTGSASARGRLRPWPHCRHGGTPLRTSSAAGSSSWTGGRARGCSLRRARPRLSFSQRPL